VEYNSDFRYDLKVGQLHEKMLADLLESKTVEVKRDFRASQTGRVFVEFFCRGKPSGISTTEADFWCFILDGETAIMLPTSKLERLANKAADNNQVVCGGDNNLSHGVLIEVADLVG
jgi:hypothetical protein